MESLTTDHRGWGYTTTMMRQDKNKESIKKHERNTDRKGGQQVVAKGWVSGCRQAAPVGVLAAATICLRQLLQKDTDGAEVGAAAAAAAAASDEGAPSSSSSSSSSSATKSASAPGMGPAPGPASAASGEKKAKKEKVDPKRTNRQR